ncbi:MAG: F0F1 ATP synthase subunit delta [Candidatus Azosocius agrarius]|nr:MAG: F0F1 ATP synthase subunit delta [Gammaproteobacteria bacterium]
MSEKMTIGRPYAKAVFLLAKTVKNYTSWAELLSFLCKFISDKSVIELVKNPMMSVEHKSNFIINFLDNELDAMQINFIRLLSKHKRLLYINEISELFNAYLEEEQGILRLEVISASGIGKEGRDRLTSVLSKKFDKSVSIKFRVEAELFGGAIIKVKDSVIDGTLKESLINLKNLLAT